VRATHPGPAGKGVLLLALAWLSRRTLGWADTVKVWRVAHPHPVRLVADSETVMRDIDFVARSVAASHPLPTECKEGALTTWMHALSPPPGCGAVAFDARATA
jgi:hypothetical protein